MQLKGFEVTRKEHIICKLTGSLYRLKYSTKHQYKNFDKFMIGKGLQDQIETIVVISKGIETTMFIYYFMQVTC